jgi:hypothetical protein
MKKEPIWKKEGALVVIILAVCLFGETFLVKNDRHSLHGD